MDVRFGPKKEGWVPKNWCFWTVVLEKTLESPLDLKEIQPVNSKGNQSWIFIGRTDAEAEALILWPPDASKKTLMLGKIEGGRRRGPQRMRWLDGITDSMTWVWVNSGSGNGQGGLECYSPWGCKESDTTEQLNWTEVWRWTDSFMYIISFSWLRTASCGRHFLCFAVVEAETQKVLGLLTVISNLEMATSAPLILLCHAI